MRTKIDYKKAINEFIDLPKLIKVIWIALWVILAYFVVLKLLFHKWYPIVVENQIFINICSFIQNNKIFYVMLGIIIYLSSCNIWYLSSRKLKKYSSKIELVIINIILLISHFLKLFVGVIGNIIELISLIILPTILNKRNKLRPIILYVIFNLWQLNMLFVRNLDTILVDNNVLLGIILMLDYYTLIIISWIGGAFMGHWTGGWFFGKTETELRAELEKERKKEKPDTEKITAIEDYLNEHFK